MEKIRTLAASQPEVYNTVSLSKEFKLSVEAVRRILKSNYVPQEQDAERQESNRYRAMGDRRKEFKKVYNIPEDNPKTFWNKKTTSKELDFSTRREERGGKNMWSNSVYKRRSFDDSASRFDIDKDNRPQRHFDNYEPNVHSRRNSYSRDDQKRNVVSGDARRNFDQRQSFRRGRNGGNYGETSYRKDRFNANEGRENKPFGRFTNENRSFNDKRSFERNDRYQDTGKRPFNRQRDNNNAAGDRRFPSNQR
ncbi:hypothetical protein BD408DRAFT_403915 [Parasitella parasitica]|nr:hypothetical protein BD408DRAFT_403915 [Parasitella parasitica]